MDNIRPNDIELEGRPKGKKSIATRLIILASIIAVLALIAIGLTYFLNNYVLFPRADKALTNALEAKFDFGMSFDLRDMTEQGAIELTAENTDILGERIDSMNASVAYCKKGAKATLSVDEERLNAVLTSKGIAASSDNFKDGAYYGTTFKELSQKLEGSFLNPENESEYALAEEKFKKLSDLASSLEDTSKSKGEKARDALTVLEAIKAASDKSPLYQTAKSYDGIEMYGEHRSARCITYTLDHKSMMGFLEALSDVFEEPTEELEGAVSRLLDQNSAASAFEDALAIELKNCDDVAELISDLARLADILIGKTKWEATLVCAYVKDAFSAITLDVNYKSKSFGVIIDFGADPKKDRNMSLRIITNPSGNKQHPSETKEYIVRYGVEENKHNTVVTASYSEILDFENDAYSESSYAATVTLDRKKDEASLDVQAFVESGDRSKPDEKKHEERELIGQTFDMVDKASHLSLRTVNGEGGEYTLTLRRSSGKIRLPKHTDVLEMEVDDADELISEFLDRSKWLEDIADLIYQKDKS